MPATLSLFRRGRCRGCGLIITDVQATEFFATTGEAITFPSDLDIYAAFHKGLGA